MHDARKRVLMRTTDNIICLSNLWFKRDELQYTLQEKNCCKTNVETVQHSCVKFRFLIILVQGNTKEVTSSKTYECSLQSKERVGIWVKICKLSTLDYEKKTCKSKKQHKMQKNNESLWYSERGTQLKGYFLVEAQTNNNSVSQARRRFLTHHNPLITKCPYFQSRISLFRQLRRWCARLPKGVTQFYVGHTCIIRTTVLHTMNAKMRYSKACDVTTRHIWNWRRFSGM